MTTVIQKPIIMTKSGHPLTIAPGSEMPLSTDKWLQKIQEWQERNRENVSKISVETFLADKHADIKKGLA